MSNLFFSAKTCLKSRLVQNIVKNIIKEQWGLERDVKICTVSQCYYHTTPIHFKKRRSAEEKKLRSMIQYTPKVKPKIPSIEIWRNMTVRDLVRQSNRSLDHILQALHLSDLDNDYKADSVIENIDVLTNTVKKLGAKYKIIKTKLAVANNKDTDVYKRPPPDPSVLVKRHPVVTIMGHVDHGKTTLLDSLRKTSVVDTEFGGITQHIGAFNVSLETGEKMTFLDTPGHAAFSTMRARGANATDIVVLVVAADDGVMEQTVQSINMAKNANVPIIVAINKIDKPNADIERAEKMLAKEGILIERLGGDVQCVHISALKGTNLNVLTETIAAQAEIMCLRGDPKGLVEGVIIESTSDAARGKLSTALIQRGTLRKGAVLVCGLAWAKVRAMFDHSGSPVSEAKLSEAVQIIGWRELPNAGDELLEVESEQIAHMVMRFRNAIKAEQKAIEQKQVADAKHQEHLITYRENLMAKRKEGRFRMKLVGPRPKESKPDDGIPRVNLIIKGDVLGSVEAILDVLDTYGEEHKCHLDVVHYGVGPVTESELELAKTFNAIIYTFNINQPAKLLQEAKKKDISLRPHNVIYKLIDDLKEEISAKLPNEFEEEVIGEANVLQEFTVTENRKKCKVAGCRCTKGNIKRNERIRVIRDNKILFDGELKSLKHLKNEVETVKKDVECGLMLSDISFSFQPGDLIVCYTTREVKPQIGWDPGF